MRYDVLGQRIALGNSGNGLVEGYATVKEIVEIPLSKIPKYESKHLATKWLIEHYGNKDANKVKKKTSDTLYCYCLTDVKKENKPFKYPKSGSIWFTLE